MRSWVSALALVVLALSSCISCVATKITYVPGVHGPRPPVDALLDRTVKVNAMCDVGSGSGSGVIIEGEKTHLTVATAEHVIAGENCKYSIETNDGETFVVYRHVSWKRADVAVLITLGGHFYPKVKMRKARLGEPVVTTGYPSDLLAMDTVKTVTRGNVAARYEGKNRASFRITAPIRPGSSGGPCWSKEGALLGLTVSVMMVGPIVVLDGHTYVTDVSNLERLLF